MVCIICYEENFLQSYCSYPNHKLCLHCIIKLRTNYTGKINITKCLLCKKIIFPKPHLNYNIITCIHIIYIYIILFIMKNEFINVYLYLILFYDSLHLFLNYNHNDYLITRYYINSNIYSNKIYTYNPIIVITDFFTYITNIFVINNFLFTIFLSPSLYIGLIYVVLRFITQKIHNNNN